MRGESVAEGSKKSIDLTFMVVAAQRRRRLPVPGSQAVQFFCHIARGKDSAIFLCERRSRFDGGLAHRLCVFIASLKTIGVSEFTELFFSADLFKSPF